MQILSISIQKMKNKNRRKGQKVAERRLFAFFSFSLAI
nr:MAG TPA: hypothetical protein [Bacteriophage sp.]